MINTCPFFLVALLKSQTEDVRKDLKLSDIRFLGLCNEIFFFKDPLLPPFFNYPYYHSTHIVLCNFGDRNAQAKRKTYSCAVNYVT